MKRAFFSLIIITFCFSNTLAMRRAAHDSATVQTLKLKLKYNASGVLARILTRFKNIQATIFVPFDAWKKMGEKAKEAASNAQLHHIEDAIRFLEPIEEIVKDFRSHPKLYDCFLTLEEKNDKDGWKSKDYSLPDLIAFLRGFLTSRNLEMLTRFRVKSNRTPSPVALPECDGAKKEREKSPTPPLDDDVKSASSLSLSSLSESSMSAISDLKSEGEAAEVPKDADATASSPVTFEPRSEKFDDGHGVWPQGEPRPALRQPVSNIHTIHQPGRPPKVTPSDLIVQKRTNYLVAGVTAVLGITIAVLFVLYRWFQRPISKKPVSNNVITPINLVNDVKQVPDKPKSDDGWFTKIFAIPTASNEEFEFN